MKVELLRTIGRVADPLSAKEADCFPGGEKGEVVDVHPAMAERLVTSRPENPAAKYVVAEKKKPAKVEPDAVALAEAFEIARAAHEAAARAHDEAVVGKAKKKELSKLQSAVTKAAATFEKATKAAAG